jgi:hypothetical protein
MGEITELGPGLHAWPRRWLPSYSGDEFRIQVLLFDECEYF